MKNSKDLEEIQKRFEKQSDKYLPEGLTESLKNKIKKLKTGKPVFKNV